MDYGGGGDSEHEEMDFSGGAADHAADDNGEVGGNYSASDYEEDPFE